MTQDLKYLPPNYRQVIAEELGCSRELVREVKRKIESEPQVLITSKMQLDIVKALKRHIDHAKTTEALTKNKAGVGCRIISGPGHTGV